MSLPNRPVKPRRLAPLVAGGRHLGRNPSQTILVPTQEHVLPLREVGNKVRQRPPIAPHAQLVPARLRDLRKPRAQRIVLRADVVHQRLLRLVSHGCERLSSRSVQRLRTSRARSAPAARRLHVDIRGQLPRCLRDPVPCARLRTAGQSILRAGTAFWPRGGYTSIPLTRPTPSAWNVTRSGSSDVKNSRVPSGRRRNVGSPHPAGDSIIRWSLSRMMLKTPSPAASYRPT